MTLIALLIGAVLIVAALRDTQGDLATALKSDVPDYIVWAAAIAAIGALGYIPGIKPAARVLLALVIVVIVLKNYTAIIAGFQNAWQHPTPVGSAATNTGANANTGTSLLGSAADSAISGAVQSGLPNFIGAP